MSEKKYFFRNNEYSNIEMIRRIPVEILAKDVIGEDGLPQFKSMSLFLERYKNSPDLVTKLKRSFVAYGRKGDVANVRIFCFDKFRYNFLIDDEINVIKN